MKSVWMRRDYPYRVSATVLVQYRKGETYKRVPEVQARAIVAAGAGEIVEQDSTQ